MSHSESDYEIDLLEIISVLWAEKLKIISITAIFALGSVIFALSLPNQYKATALLAPAHSDGSGLSGAVSQLGNIASFAGLRIGGFEITESSIAQEIMKSWSFIEKFIDDNDLAVEIYAAEGWNKETDTLMINDEIYDVSSGKWLIEDIDTGGLRPPTSWELFQRFDEILSVSENKKTGLVSVSVEYYSPKIAKQWLDSYFTAINEHMQMRQVVKVSNNINYLQQQIEKTSIAETREVFYTIIEEQTKKKMVAEASPDYAFVALSDSMVPERKSKPNRAIICLFITFLGGVIAVLYVVLAHYFQEGSSELKK